MSQRPPTLRLVTWPRFCRAGGVRLWIAPPLVATIVLITSLIVRPPMERCSATVALNPAVEPHISLHTDDATIRRADAIARDPVLFDDFIHATRSANPHAALSAIIANVDARYAQAVPAAATTPSLAPIVTIRTLASRFDADSAPQMQIEIQRTRLPTLQLNQSSDASQPDADAITHVLALLTAHQAVDRAIAAQRPAIRDAETQLDADRAALAAASEALQQFRDSLNTADRTLLEAAGHFPRFEALEAELASTSVRTDEAEAQKAELTHTAGTIRAIRDAITSTLPTDSATERTDEQIATLLRPLDALPSAAIASRWPNLDDAQRRDTDLRAALSAVSIRYTPLHPDVRRAATELIAHRRAMVATCDTIHAAIDGESKSAAALAAGHRADLERITARRATLTDRLPQLIHLEKAVADATTGVEATTQRAATAGRQRSEVTQWRLIAVGTPQRDHLLRWSVILPTAMLMWVLLTMATWRQIRSDSRVRTADDVDALLGIPLLGNMPRHRRELFH